MKLSAMHSSALLFLLIAQISLVMLIIESSSGLAARCVHETSPVKRLTFCRERMMFRHLSVEPVASSHSGKAQREEETNKKTKAVKIITRWIKQGAKSLRSVLHIT